MREGFIVEIRRSTGRSIPREALVTFTLVACAPEVERLDAGGDAWPPPPGTSEGASESTARVADDGTRGTSPHESDPEIGFFDSFGDFIFDDPYQCSPWSEDCPRGQKCMPWAKDGGPEWNALRCTPIAKKASAIGAPCSVTGGPVSGFDSCEPRAMCWNVDRETLVGECVAMCEGSEAHPVCAVPQTECMIANQGVLTLCLRPCDPIIQDCIEGQGCYPMNGAAFACVVDVSSELGSMGDPCDFRNTCDPGLLCVAGEGVPGCTSNMCCTRFCDVHGAEPPCFAGQSCVPYWEDVDHAPPGYEPVGICFTPE